MYTLYHFPYSQHARRVVSLLEEANLPYQLKHVAMDNGEHLLASYLTINPNHQVPTLVDGSFTLFESNAILRYLATKHKLTRWYPEDIKEKACVDQWLDWNQCRLAPNVVDIVLNTVFLGADGDKSAVKRGQERIVELFKILDDALGKTAYVAGDHATIADLSVASNIFQLSLAEVALPGKHLNAWYKKMMEVAGFKKSLPL